MANSTSLSCPEWHAIFGLSAPTSANNAHSRPRMLCCVRGAVSARVPAEGRNTIGGGELFSLKQARFLPAFALGARGVWHELFWEHYVS